MLLETRTTPRYVIEDPALVTLDSVVQGTVVNVSEVGFAIATPYKPVLNSIMRVSVHLPDNDSPCDARAQVVWAASSGQIGLKLLKPESFRTHFETWRRFSTQKIGTACSTAQPQPDTEATICGTAQPQPDTAMDAVGERLLDLEGLQTAILQDAESTHLPIFSRTGILAGVIGCALLAGTMWLWYGRTHKSDANTQASSSPPAEVASVATPAPTDLTQNASEPAPAHSTADAAAVPSTAEVSRSGESKKSEAVPIRNEHRGASHAQIIIDLNRFTQVNPKLLHNPDRIYFDLIPGTRPKLSKGSTLGSGNRLVRRIRIGHAENGHTRVVLDLLRPCHYQAKISPTLPYKLIINIREERVRGTS
jgi:PilZ domain-containing protein/AMIN domain-containing protein